MVTARLATSISLGFQGDDVVVDDYLFHYQVSRERFAQFVINSPNNSRREEWQQLHDMLGTIDMECQVDEFRYAMESYDDTAEQVKLIYSYDSGHTLKIKWEHTGWWAGDVLHHYYCVLLPLRNVPLVFPHELATAGEQE